MRISMVDLKESWYVIPRQSSNALKHVLESLIAVLHRYASLN